MMLDFTETDIYFLALNWTAGPFIQTLYSQSNSTTPNEYGLINTGVPRNWAIQVTKTRNLGQ